MPNINGSRLDDDFIIYNGNHYDYDNSFAELVRQYTTQTASSHSTIRANSFVNNYWNAFYEEDIHTCKTPAEHYKEKFFYITDSKERTLEEYRELEKYLEEEDLI